MTDLFGKFTQQRQTHILTKRQAADGAFMSQQRVLSLRWCMKPSVAT